VDTLSKRFNIKNFNIVLNGDMVSGREVYRYQYLRNIIQRGHWQVELAAHLTRELVNKVGRTIPVNKIFVIKGNHENRAENYPIYLTHYLPNVWYAGHNKVLNIAYPIGNYNVLFTHGFGGNSYYPVSLSLVRDCWKAMAQYRLKNIQIEEIACGHSIPGYRNVLIKTDGVIKLLPIEECPETFDTLVFNEQNESVWSRALKYSHPYKGQMITAASHCGEIEVTTGHSVFVYENGQMITKKGNELEIGDKLIHLKNIPTDTHEVDKSLSTEDAWVMGFYCADGWSGKYKKGVSVTYNVGFANADRIRIERIRDYFHTKYPSPNVKKRTITCVDDKLYQMQVYSKKAYLYFKDMCGSGVRNKKIPNSIFNSDIDIRNAFMKGYYDGDGEKCNLYRWGTSSKMLYDGIITLLKMNKETIVENNFSKEKSKLRQYTTLRKDKLREDHLRGSWIGYSTNSDIEDHGHFYTSAIKELSSRDYDDMVYDLEVPDNPMFFDARGMTLIHNTHWLQPRLMLEGLTFNVTGGFQRWEYSMSQRPSGMLLFIYSEDNVTVSAIRPDLEIEEAEKGASDLEFTNMEYYSVKLKSALQHLKKTPPEVVI